MDEVLVVFPDDALEFGEPTFNGRVPQVVLTAEEPLTILALDQFLQIDN